LSLLKFQPSYKPTGLALLVSLTKTERDETAIATASYMTEWCCFTEWSI